MRGWLMEICSCLRPFEADPRKVRGDSPVGHVLRYEAVMWCQLINVQMTFMPCNGGEHMYLVCDFYFLKQN